MLAYSSYDIAFMRFLSKVRNFGAPGKCWEWIAGKDSKGYGQFYYRDKNWRAHKWLWHYVNGPVAPGYELHHRCENEACVNIAQCVEPLTFSEHRFRSAIGDKGAYRRSLTHCPQGHAYDEANTYYFPDGRRKCKACARLRYREAHNVSEFAYRVVI